MPRKNNGSREGMLKRATTTLHFRCCTRSNYASLFHFEQNACAKANRTDANYHGELLIVSTRPMTRVIFIASYQSSRKL